MYRRKRKHMVKPKRRTDPKREAEACAEAFRRCRPDLKKFILAIEGDLYAKGIISDDTHDDIHGQSIVESEKRRILLDAVENKLRAADGSDEFDIILGLFKKDRAHNIVAKRLSEIRESCRSSSVTIRKQSSQNWINEQLVYFTVAAIVVLVVSFLLCYHIIAFDSEENDLTRFLKNKYSTYNLELGHSYTKVPYVNLSIFQYPDQDWMAKSNAKQGANYSMTSQSVEELLNVSTGDRILIIGGPGTGKTRLTLEIMRMWTNNKVLLSCELLFVYRLRWFSLQKKEIDLRSIVSMHMEGGPVVDEIVNEAFNTGGKKLCFLFDGLDEYEPGYSDMNNYVFSLMHRRKLSNAIVIVTSRNITSTGFEAIEWTRQYHVSGFSNKQLKSYFQRYSMHQFAGMHKHQSLWQICRIPLHASLVVNTLKGKLINSTIFTTTQLFEAITVKTFESDLRKANEPAKTDIFNNLKHLLLEVPVFARICALAFKGSLNTPRQYSFNDSEIPSELKWTNLSYFQVEPQPGARNMEVYTFIHPTLMDFLAAVHFTSLSEDEQSSVIANEKQCLNINFGYDDFWTFVCGLRNHFTPFFKALYNYNCYKSFWLTPLKISHCIFEAQPHSAHEVQSAAQYFMWEDDRGFLGLQLAWVTLTAYDMQAIGFVVSTISDVMMGLTLLSVTVADEDYDLSFLFFSLSKPKAIFSNLEVLFFSHIVNAEVKFKESVKDFFERTPRLELLELIDVSWPMVQQLTLLAPPSCDSMIIYNTSLGEITPYSLFKQCRKMSAIHVANCKLKDEDLLDMRSTPWSIDTNLFGLSNNSIGNEGAISIATSIKNLCSFITCKKECGPLMLDLKYNSIGGEGLVALLEATVCSRLNVIDLTGNNVTDNDVDLITRTCLTLNLSRWLIPVILLPGNNITEEGKAQFAILERSRCSISFEYGSALGYGTDTGPMYRLIESVDATTISIKHYIQNVEKELETTYQNAT